MTLTKYLSFDKSGIPITIVGLPQAGKTTFVNRMKTGTFTIPNPTTGMHFERINIQDIHFDIFDLGGHEIYRKTIWESYIKLSYGIIFIIDSANESILEEVKKEFWRCMSIKEKDEEFLLLFLCNKSDLEKSMNLEILVKKLELYKLAQIPNLTYQFFKVSMKTGEHYEYIMNWLHNKTEKITSKRKITPLMILIAQKSGLFILSIDKLENKQDPNLVSGFLSAVEGFTREVFRNEGFLQFILEENHKYIISAKEENIYAILIDRDDSQEEARRIIEIIDKYYEKTKNYESLEQYILQIFRLDIRYYNISRAY